MSESYEIEFDEAFEKDFKALKKKPEILKRLRNKIAEIIEAPHHYKPLRNVLKNRRRAHIGSYVLIFEIREEKKTVR